MSGRGQGSGVRGGDWWYVQAAGREDRRIPRLLRPYECMHACPDRSRPQRELCLFCPAATSLTSLSTCTHCWLLLYLYPGNSLPTERRASIGALLLLLKRRRVCFSARQQLNSTAAPAPTGGRSICCCTAAGNKEKQLIVRPLRPAETRP